MSVQIKLYHLPKSESIYEIEDLATAIENAKKSSADLYKVYQDIGMVLANDINPFSKENQPIGKLIFGNKINVQVGWRQCVGYIPCSEIEIINGWINSEKIAGQQSFYQKYENLSPELKEELEEMCSPPKDEMYNGYILSGPTYLS